MSSVLSASYMHDPAAAFAHAESIIWPDGPVCPFCGVVANAYELKCVLSKPSKKNPEGVERHGPKKCKDCGKQFTVRKGTIFEESHIALHRWLQAIQLITCSKMGISSNQIHRVLGITLKSAWFMSHRIREAIRDDSNVKFGSGGGAVEVDESFIGREPGKPLRRAFHHKMKAQTLVDRKTGPAKSIVVDDLKPAAIAPILRENMAKEACLMPDEGGHYLHIGREFAEHGVVKHGKEAYLRGDAYANTVEGYFSVFRRGMRGVYQHGPKKHLHRYRAEFTLRYNHRIANGFEDTMRASATLKGAVGKRLTYTRPDARLDGSLY